jgi:hypothetical protein
MQYEYNTIQYEYNTIRGRAYSDIFEYSDPPEGPGVSVPQQIPSDGPMKDVRIGSARITSYVGSIQGGYYDGGIH